METNNRLFNVIEPKNSLKEAILNSIKIENNKRNNIKIYFNSVISLISVSVTVFLIIYLIKDAHQSGILKYISLLFSDGALITSYWQTYAMSIFESLAVLPITITLASVWIFIWSINSSVNLYRIRDRFLKTKFVS